MQDLPLSTPALLFPTISLLILAYTNRFITLANLVRELHRNYESSKEEKVYGQIKNLRFRIRVIQLTQFFGITSLLCCTGCMLLIYLQLETAASVIFITSLILMVVSLICSLIEIQRSVQALDLQMKDLE